MQLTEETREDLQKLNSVPLLSPTRGGQVLLGQVASITPAQGRARSSAGTGSG